MPAASRPFLAFEQGDGQHTRERIAGRIAITTPTPRWCAARTACEAARGEIS
jgi:hypothetical protein